MGKTGVVPLPRFCLLTAAGGLLEGRFSRQDGIDDGRGFKDESSSGCLFLPLVLCFPFGYISL